MTTSNKQDERLVRRDDSVPGAESRQDRSAADKERVVDDSLKAKIAALRSGWSDDVIPVIEGDPNYHYCWLSTTNQSDPIYRRLKLGYELVKFDELSYLGEQNRVQSGEFAGCVSINELILAKIPKELHHEIMLINHHEKPMQEEELLRANMETDDKDSDGRQLGQVFGDGIENLGQRSGIRRRPTFG